MKVSVLSVRFLTVSGTSGEIQFRTCVFELNQTWMKLE